MNRMGPFLNKLRLSPFLERTILIGLKKERLKLLLIRTVWNDGRLLEL